MREERDRIAGRLSALIKRLLFTEILFMIRKDEIHMLCSRSAIRNDVSDLGKKLVIRS
jgi:hypothetical protein